MKVVSKVLLGAFLASAVPIAPSWAIQAADPSAAAAGPMPALSLSAVPTLNVTPSLQANALRAPAVASRVEAFEKSAGGRWEMRWDARGDRPNVVQGSGIPLIPGSGNRLASSRFGASGANDLDLATVLREARRFLDSQSALLKLDGIELRPDAERSASVGADKTFWSIEFGQYRNGVRVDGAFVYVRVSHGNVVQFGAERIADVRTDTTPKSNRQEAFLAAWNELAFPPGTRVEKMTEAGELRLYPVAPAGSDIAAAFLGTPGRGYEHVLAWRYVFSVAGSPVSWQILVDAHSNRVIDLRDLTVNVDATVTGGVYPKTNLEPEVVMPLPFAAVDNGGAKITDTLGIYDYSGGTASTSLDGKYFTMADGCGAISLSSSTDGNLSFGSGSGTDCVTPDGNTAGPGNTHASRTGFYHLSRINEKARGILPNNTWLQGKVTANMNVDQTCNANFNPSNGTLNFFKSGANPNNPSIQCGNTGEIAAVFLHEWGHGLDNNEGGAAPEYGSGEAVGDTFAFLETKDSCIGPGFFKSGQVCHDCTTCTGVRDLNDFSLTGTRTIATPANVTATDGIDCGAFIGTTGVACPFIQLFAPYQGPMGYEGHCESYIASSANWDLKNALVDRFGDSGNSTMDGIWYKSLLPSKSAYQVQDGGQCNPQATVNGCAATNWYTVYLAADDDDGDLSNGTPNACRIWDAMNAHGIACGERPVCTADGPDFTLRLGNDPQRVCAATSAQFNLNIGSQLGFTNPVTLAASGQPSGATVNIAPNPVTPGGSATMTVGTSGVAAGNYTLRVDGSASGSNGHGVNAHLTIDAAAPVATALSSPADGATGIDNPTTTLTWQAAAQAGTYTVEVALDAAFTMTVAEQSGLTATSWQVGGLRPNTTYYWRVRATNGCGAGTDSPVWSFTTNNFVCSNPALAIPGTDAAGVDDVLTIDQQAQLTGLRVKIKADYLLAGDLKFTLSHGATSLLLKDRDSSCFASNLDAIFADDGVAIDCSSGTISGTLLPAAPLDPAFAGQAFAGDWKLNVSGSFGQFISGTLNQWCLDPKSVPTTRYTVGGNVSGLTGSGLTLVLNGGAPLPVSADGAFVFPAPLDDGTNYAVTVATQPSAPAQTCTVSNGSGTIAGANVTDVGVNCSNAITDRIFVDGFDGGSALR